MSARVMRLWELLCSVSAKLDGQYCICLEKQMDNKMDKSVSKPLPCCLVGGRDRAWSGRTWRSRRLHSPLLAWIFSHVNGGLWVSENNYSPPSIPIHNVPIRLACCRFARVPYGNYSCQADSHFFVNIEKHAIYLVMGWPSAHDFHSKMWGEIHNPLEIYPARCDARMEAKLVKFEPIHLWCFLT